MFQGNVIQNNAKNGVIVQQYGLALQDVNRSLAGNYTCVASNVEGDGYSNIVELKIMCKYPLSLIALSLSYLEERSIRFAHLVYMKNFISGKFFLNTELLCRK